MKIVTVIPLARGIQKENLTYFTGKDTAIGTIVSVPIRKKTADAIVVDIADLAAAKSAVKTSAFNLKKIIEIKGPSFFKPEFLESAVKAAKYYASTPGSLIASLLPKIFLEKHDKLRPPIRTEKRISPGGARTEKLIFQAPLADRMSFYKTFVRESFARKKSVAIVLPTVKDVEIFAEALGRGIENYVFSFHGELTDKKIIEKYNAAVECAHPVLIVSTGQYLSIPRSDLGAIVVEKEGSAAYRRAERPYADMRTFAEILAGTLGIKIIFADSYLRPETVWRRDEHEASELSPLTFRAPAESEIEIISTKKNPDAGKNKFKALTAEAKEEIRQALLAGRKIFLFTLRKGLAPFTVCHDCGETLLCDYCSAPLALYQKDKGRIYACNRCHKEKKTNLVCLTCGGWNMTMLGVGTELVSDEIKKEFPKAKVSIFSREKIKSAKAARAAMNEFKKSGDILIGTEFALHYIDQPISASVVISLDSLFSIPNYRINEKIMRLLLEIRSATDKKMLVQTKNPDEQVLKSFQAGQLAKFYREELEDRKALNYPPFSRLIKITWRGGKAEMEKTKAKMAEIFNEYNPYVFAAFIHKVKNLYVLNTVLKIDRALWSLPEIGSRGRIDEKLLAQLLSLPPYFGVQVDPEDLL